MPTRPSVMAHTFSMVPKAEIPRSSFDRTHGYKTTFDAGYLVPIFVDEALPGDTFHLNMTGFCRLSTPLKPYMDNAYMNTFFFSVPNRLIWDNWQKFNGEQTNPGDSTDYLVPQLVYDLNGCQFGSIGDHFGLPIQVAGLSVNALPFRAYNLIFNEWFRDENLRTSLLVSKDDGPDDPVEYALQRRGKRHDYFTSCLPWPQKGESVTIPLGGYAPVVGDNIATGDAVNRGFPSFRWDLVDPPSRLASLAADRHVWLQDVTSPGFAGPLQWASPQLSADLTSVGATTINALRQAFQVQKLYERDARGGTRYTEILRAHFGVVSPDARLQRPEYLGGGQSAINISQVPQTSASLTDGTPQGNLAAIGTSVMHNHGFSKSFTEHCTIIGMICVRADLTYQQGLDRMWSRRSRFDYYWPALAHIGEQAVLSKEIFCDDDALGNDSVFGYQERFAEYRYKPSRITNQFRSTFPESLDYWHLAQDFETRPLLNMQFIEEYPPFERVVATPAEPIFLGDFYFKMRCARPMPVYGVPGLIDHF